MWVVLELGALGNYTGSPFLPSESDILLDFPEHDDSGSYLTLISYYIIYILITNKVSKSSFSSVEEYFVDNIIGPGSDEEKP